MKILIFATIVALISVVAHGNMSSEIGQKQDLCIRLGGIPQGIEGDDVLCLLNGRVERL